jgi:hypothetical protein
MNGEQSASKQHKQHGSLFILLILLGGALAFLCRQGLAPHEVLFANDVSLGAMIDSADRLPGTFAGHWDNLEFLGGAIPSSSPSFSALLQTIFPPEIFMKIYAPMTMLFLGLGAWLFFRQAGFAPGVCVVGGLGAGLNMHYFSNACWGLGQWDISAAMTFVALAVLVSPSIRPLWVKGALVGLSIGMTVMEGFDTGAILSLYAGIFIVFYFLILPDNPVKAVPKTLVTGVVVVFFALLISASTIYTLIGSTFTETASTGKTETEKKEHWIFLTTYSFPKMESLRLIIPGLYGYRLQEFMTSTNKSSAYWGTIAEDWRVAELESGSPAKRAQGAVDLGIQNPEIQKILVGNDTPDREKLMDNIKSQLPRRHSGSGDYVGELVCLMAFFGLFSSWRKINGPFSKTERQTIWFWGFAALFSLLAAWGRYGSVYQFIAPLPFIRNIRNPIKFLHPLNVCMIILSGYGMEALHRCYMRPVVKRAGTLSQNAVRWWKGFEKKWTIGTLLVLAAAITGLLILSSSKQDLIHHLARSGFSEELAPQIAAFCIREVFLFVVFFAVSAGIVIGILSGAFSGGRAVLAWIFLGAVMIVDLSRADTPWVRYFDYKQKYSMNPVTEFLRHEPWEHRVVSARRSPVQPIYDLTQVENFGGVCHFWLENDYMANDIEALEIDQAPRMPDLERNYIGNFSPRSQQDLTSTARMWLLTNTRYILADDSLTPVLNQVIEPKNSFHTVMRFDLAMKPGLSQPEDAGDLTIETNDNGRVALIEYTQALPRARLYANWQMTDDTTALQKLAALDFDPAKTVLVATNTPLAQTPAQPGADAGTVIIASYHPKDIKLQADAKTPAILLFNERFGDHWNVWVDQQPASLLRCNYIMRGVFVPQGAHTIEFRFQPPLSWLYVSASALGLGVLLAGYVAFARSKPESDSSETPEKTPEAQNRKTV